MTWQERVDEQKLYGAVRATAHGGDLDYTFIGFDIEELRQNSGLMAAIRKAYPSAYFEPHLPGTIKLSREDGDRFMLNYDEHKDRQERSAAA